MPHGFYSLLFDEPVDPVLTEATALGAFHLIMLSSAAASPGTALIFAMPDLPAVMSLYSARTVAIDYVDRLADL
jgi:hypothetical protein